MPDETPPSASDPLFGNNPSDLMRGAMDPTQPVTDPRNWQPPAPETLQAMLPGYEVQAFLARGGMGAVYRGEQISLGRPVAIKILPPELSDSDPHYSARFKQEARAMAQLNHPSIVSVYDFGEMPDGTFYFIMEFIDGTDVGQMVAKQGRLSSAHAMSITAHVCDALQYAHKRGIVHRDIKPANIMVGYNGQVKVADFGLAKSAKQKDLGLTQDGYVMGTPFYVSPEALIMGLQVDHRADIYAVGVMLYEMLTGKVPQGLFEMPSLQVPGLDPRYDGIVSSAMRDDRDKRYQSVLEMRRALDSILTQPVLRSEVAKQTVPGSVVSKNKPTSKATPPKPQPDQRDNQPLQAAAPTPRSKRFKKPVVGWIVNAAAVALLLGGLKWFSREKPIEPKVAITTANEEAPKAELPKASEPAPSTPSTPSITPINNPAFEQELGAVSWKIADQDWVAYFQPNHEVVVRKIMSYSTLRWWGIGPKKIHVQYESLGEDWEVNSEMTQITRISDGKLIAERDRSRPANSLGDESGFVTLLGSLSSGWRYSGPANANFGQSSGIYSFAARPPKNQPGMFWYANKTFADFILRLEFRTTAFKKNSGVYLRLPTLGEGIQPLNIPGSYEIEIADQKTGIVPFTREGNLQPPPLIVGDWNTWEITAQGQAYEARLNGVLVTRFTGNGKTSGHIGIQDFDDGMAIEFRNVRIKELTPSTNLVNAPTAGAPIQQKLAELEIQVRKAWDRNSAELVTAEVTALGKSYLANGFPKALTEAKRRDDQAEIAALEKERDAFISNPVVPTVNEVNTHPTIKALRATYHRAKLQIETSKRPMPITLYEPYFAELRKLIPTVSGDDRKAVMKRYEELFAEAGFHTVTTPQMTPEYKRRCSGLERQTLLKNGGGSPECERAITNAFEYLKSKQNPDGSWGSQLPCLTTSLVLMAYLGRCEDAESPFYEVTVIKALMFLIERSRRSTDGVIASPNSTDPEVEHGASTWALGEAYLMARFGTQALPGLRDAFEKGIQLILKHKLPIGGWLKLGNKYSYSSGVESDLYVTFWQYMALHQAKRSGIKFTELSSIFADSGFLFPNRFNNRDGSFGTNRDDGRRDPTKLTGMVIHAREFAREGGDYWIERGRKFLGAFIRAEPPKWDRGDLMAWLFITESLRNDEELWPLWNRGFLPEVLSQQRPDGGWPARPTIYGSGSEEETAALCILMLETYYRSVKLEDKRRMR